MIPKIIHYCWFGGNPLPKDVTNYIDSWKKYCPDYEIKEWNESNFDIHSNGYVEQAYNAKKWAFVSDYVRLYSIYHFGGIYMDTDVEVRKPLDEFLKYEGFTGFQSYRSPLTGTMGCCKGNEIIGQVLKDYQNRQFIKEDGKLDLTTNIIPFKKIVLQHGFELKDIFQEHEEFAIYPSEYFCAYDFDKQKHIITPNTYTIHHFAGSWIPRRQRIRRKIKMIVKKSPFGHIASLFKS